MAKKGPVTRLKEVYLELLSEHENYSRRKEKESEELRSLSALPLLKNLFPVLDDFERLFARFAPARGNARFAPARGNSVQNETKSAELDGVRVIFNHLKKVLQDFGVEEFSLLGKEFDPQLAEAVDFVVREDREPLIVVEELAKGYLFRGRVIRPARVIVNKG